MISKIKILYLTNIFQSEIRWIDQIFLSDYFLYEFHFKIIKKLLNWGNEVTFKPHPESFYFPNLKFNDKNFKQINNKKIEEIFQNYDLFIFDKIKTSALHFALSKKLPVIIFPFGENDWICKKKKKEFYLNNNVVDYSCSSNGSIKVSWDILKKKINEIV